ncbi:MAG: hypothetical protein V1860_02365 [bacterium]
MKTRIKLKKLFVSLLILFGFLGVLFSQTQKIVIAQEVWGEGDTVKTNIEQETGLTAKDPRLIIANIIKIFLGFLGLLTLLIIMYAGFLWMTAGGESEKIDQAKKLLKNAVIGILIILSSYAIVNFIFSRFINNGNIKSSGIPNQSAPSYIGVLGENIIENHYPSRNQKDVPRNTKIIITFREEMAIDSIMQNIADCGDGIICGDLNFISVRIFPTKKHDSCEYNGGEYTKCEINNILRVKVKTKDKKTFLFKPQEALAGDADYSVYLSSGIKKADKKAAFGNAGNYIWSFSVSMNIDLTPPQVKNVFPYPDNYGDDYNSISPAAPARWEINVKGLPNSETNAAAAISLEGKVGSATAVLAGKYEGNKDGKIKVYISNELKAVIYFSEEGQTFKEIIARSIIGNFLDLGYGLNLKFEGDNFEAGNQWIIDVKSAKKGDYIILGNKKYVFGNNIITSENDTASAVAEKISAAIIKEQGDLVEVNNDGAKIKLVAKVAGEDANNMPFSSSNNNTIERRLISEGSNSITTPAKRGGILDTPINSIIQINFNEAIDPLSAGAYIKVSAAQGEIPGQLLFSNQYKTVEFRPDNICGQNSCGETVYCLPKKEQIFIKVKAGEIEGTCAADSDCSDYPVCELSGNIKVCKKEEGGIKKNNPAAKFGSGVADMCDNSLDGNRNMNAEGPGNGNNPNQSGKNGYFENNIYAICTAGDVNEYKLCKKDNNICAVKDNCKYLNGEAAAPAAERLISVQNNSGDDYGWSFYTSNDMVQSAPEIIKRTPSSGAQGIAEDDPLTSTFNRLIMSSTLKTGVVKFSNGDIHTRIILKSNSSSGIGYWAEKEDIDAAPRDGYADETEVIIKHDKFEKENSYSGDIGSGVKDIYQNCYNPSVGPCAANPTKQCVNCGESGSCDAEK